MSGKLRAGRVRAKGSLKRNRSSVMAMNIWQTDGSRDFREPRRLESVRDFWAVVHELLLWIMVSGTLNLLIFVNSRSVGWTPTTFLFELWAMFETDEWPEDSVSDFKTKLYRGLFSDACGTTWISIYRRERMLWIWRNLIEMSFHVELTG